MPLQTALPSGPLNYLPFRLLPRPPRQTWPPPSLRPKAYVESVDRFLSCREGHLSSLEHNFFVAEAHSAAERYNQALRDFQQRESIAKS